MTNAMRIAVAGAGGTLGAEIVAAVAAAGHVPVPLSRRLGVDLVSGVGLAERLEGAAAVIDASGPSSTRTKDSVDFFTTATRRLLAAEREAGVPHHIVVSIIGASIVDAGYYAGKAAQEAMLRDEPGGWSILRTAQFHEFVEQLLRQGRVGPVQVVPTMRSQPVAAAEVAGALVAIAAGPPRGLDRDLAGPQEERMAALVRTFFHASHWRRPVVELSLPGAWARGLRDGSLLPRADARLGSQTFDQWLDAKLAERTDRAAS